MTDDAQDLRQKLYQNGFTPLPNKRKMCLVKGWSTMDVTPETIAGWSARKAPERRFHDTGLRCGDIVALDFDVDDKDLLNKLLDELVENGVIAESPFVRIGRPPRELWVYRTRDKIGKRTTGKFAAPDAPEDEEGFAVEVLGRGCQFAAFGQRDDKTAYTWPVDNLLEHAYMDLPEITLQQADAVKDYAAKFFVQNGLVRRSPGGGTDAGYTHVFDLTDEQVLTIKDMGELPVSEIRDVLLANPDEVLRCSAQAFRPSSGRLDSCMVSLVDGDVCVSDHGTYTTHFMASSDTVGATGALGQMLAERQQRRELAKAAAEEPMDEKARDNERVRKLLDLDTGRLPLDPTVDLDTNLKTVLDRYVYVQRDNAVADALQVGYLMSMDHFRNQMAPFYREEKTKGGGTKVARLADLWLQHPRRREVHSVAMRPDRTAPLYADNGNAHLNTYVAHQPPTTGDAQPGLDFLVRLLPVESERRYFMQWLGFKLNNPGVRGPAIIMVAHESYGTGRGTLFKILYKMFAAGLVTTISFDDLTGKTYQSQYNDWLVDSLMVCVNEAQENATSVSRWTARHNAYEKLKEIVDPDVGFVHVRRKGLKNYDGVSFASMIVATNHSDSVVLPVNDRRFFICENGKPQDPGYWTYLRDWMEIPANIGAFMSALRSVDMSDYNPYAMPPMTVSKVEMIDAGTSDLDKVMDRVMNLFVNTLVVKEQVLLRLEDAIADGGFEMPDDWQRIAERMFLRQTRKLVALDDRVKIDGRVRIVRMRGTPPENAMISAESVVVEVLKQGPVTRPISSSGRVIAFPSSTPPERTSA